MKRPWIFLSIAALTLVVSLAAAAALGGALGPEPATATGTGSRELSVLQDYAAREAADAAPAAFVGGGHAGTVIITGCGCLLLILLLAVIIV